MRVLLPFLALYRRHWFRISLGILLALITLLASIILLSLSGWFLSATALAGFAGLYTFNYLLPAGSVRASAIIRTVARYTERLVSHDATFRVLTHLRIFTFRKILPLSPAGIAKFRQAELLNRLVADVDTLDHLYLRVVSPLFSALAVITLVTLGLSILDSCIALTLGGIMLALLLLLPILFYQAGKPIGQALTTLRSQYRVQLTTWLQSLSELVVFGAEKRFRAVLNQIEQQWLQQQQQQNNLSALSQSMMILGSGLTVTLLLWLGSSGIGPHTSPGPLLALLVFATLAAFEALGPITGAFQHLGHVVASADRVSHLLTQQPEVNFPATDQALPECHINGITLTITNMSFTYPGQPLPVLQEINLSVAAGKHIALLGRTGCGKSTLLQLLTRAWDIEQGEIHLNQHPLSSYPESLLRRTMSVVTQRVYLFSSTLRDNLLLAAPDADDQQLQLVLQQVGLHSLLTGHGLNAWMGEGGRQLSGGELRRLGIARVLLHSAPLILLDEPTEGLDAETEQHILALLRTQCRHKTMIIVTHRLRGLENMDHICVMDGGRLVEQGSHQALLAKQGYYAQFHQCC